MTDLSITSTDTSPVFVQPCRGCGRSFPYDVDADYCPACVAVNVGTCAECGHLHFFGCESGYGVCPVDGCDCEGQ